MTVTVPGVPGSEVAADPANTREKKSRAWTWSVLAVLAIGVALRAWQYFANASIVLDEAAVARNVLDRHGLGLLAPLDYGQVAPPGFLLAVKLCTMLFGPSEWMLRLTPLSSVSQACSCFLWSRGLCSHRRTFGAGVTRSSAVSHMDCRFHR